MFPRNNPQKQRPILAFGDWIVNVYFQIFSSLFHKNTKGWPDLRLANLVDVSPALWSLWSEARLQGSMAEMQELRSSAEEFKQRRSELGHFFCCVVTGFLWGKHLIVASVDVFLQVVQFEGLLVLYLFVEAPNCHMSDWFYLDIEALEILEGQLCGPKSWIPIWYLWDPKPRHFSSKGL